MSKPMTMSYFGGKSAASAAAACGFLNRKFKLVRKCLEKLQKFLKLLRQQVCHEIHKVIYLILSLKDIWMYFKRKNSK